MGLPRRSRTSRRASSGWVSPTRISATRRSSACASSNDLRSEGLVTDALSGRAQRSPWLSSRRADSARRPSGTRSPTSGPRRSPTRSYSRSAAAPGGDVPAAARVRLRRSASSSSSRSSRRRSTSSRDYVYFSSVSDSWVEHAARYVEAMIPRFGLGARELRRRDREQRRLPAAVVRAGAACRCSGSSRRRTWPRSPRSEGIPTLVEFFGGETADAARRRGPRGRPDASATTCSPTCRSSTTSSRACSVLLAPGGVDHDGVPAPAAADRGDAVRHDLPRALLVLLAAGRRAGLRARTVCALFDVEELPTHGGSLRIYALPRRGRAAARRPSASPSCASARSAAGLTRARDLHRVRRARCETEAGAARASCSTAQARGQDASSATAPPAKGKTLAQLLRHPLRPRRVRRRPQPAQAGPVHAREPHPGPFARADRRDEARLPAHPAWNLKDEIMAQMAHIRELGTRFVTPVPHIEVHE